MSTDHRAKLATIKRFDQLIAYLRDEMGWPIARDSFEEVDDLFYDFTADELGIDVKTAAKIESIKRLRPLSSKQPWGIFFVKFERKKLPVVALRRILSQVAIKKRGSANSAERAAWAADDLLFVSNYGEGDERQISFAHFSRAQDGHDLPTLKVLGWDNRDTALHLDAVVRELTEHLSWPANDADAEAWRESWRAAFKLRHYEVVKTAKDLSIRLAKLARNIRDRIHAALAIETDKGPLTKLMKAFQESLIHDLDAHSFADMYAQTIAYGLLSARIADPQRKTADDFAAHMRTNPFLRELLETFIQVGGRSGKAGGPGLDFDELGVSEVIELLDDANMEAVVRDFGDRNPQEDPVTHFYEGFAKEYDPIDKVKRGEFYTPRPVVSYIVRSVDALLRTEFGLADGLADTTSWAEIAKRRKDLKIPEGVSPNQDFVQILDPATGTGTFLVEVVDQIHRTLVAKWKALGHGQKKIEELWNEYVPKHLLTRLYAYELKMAPYAIAHMKIGLKLYETGYRFSSDERARVYLTNTLEPPSSKQLTLAFLPALAHEAAAVNEVKQKARFTVIIGNPPYAGHSSNNGLWATQLVKPYYFVDGRPLGERNPKWLQDDYVKFIRASQVLCDATPLAVFSFITNHGYIDNPTFRGMRQSILNTFEELWILDLHGNVKKEETTTEGTLDKNVFDIQQGVAIMLASRGIRDAMKVKQSDLFGTRESKNEFLSRNSFIETPWQDVRPTSPFYVFVPQNDAVRSEYLRYSSIKDVMPVNVLGFQTHRDHFAIALDRDEIVTRCEALRGRKLKDSEIRETFDLKDNRDWNVKDARSEIRSDEKWTRHVVPCLYRPFDVRWSYFSTVAMDYPRRELLDHVNGKVNLCLLLSRQQATPGFRHSWVATLPANDCVVSTKSSEANQVFPLWLFPVNDRLAFRTQREPNISSEAIKGWTSMLGAGAVDASAIAEEFFYYAYAVFNSDAYRSRYEEFLRIDYPRLPLTASRSLIKRLIELGRDLVALHVLESPKLNRGQPDYIGSRSLKIERVSWSKNTVWLDKAQSAGFRGVPEAVWNFQVGGFQVCESWLKHRKGRRLSIGDIAHYQKIVVAVSETLRLKKEIDEAVANYGGWPRAFQPTRTGAASAKLAPFRPRIIEPKHEERYSTCIPLIPLKAAAGAFSDPQNVRDEDFEWVAVPNTIRARQGMFVAQVVGKSMEPIIPDGAWCVFRVPLEGTRQGKVVLVQLRDERDPETGQRYTVKRYVRDEPASAGQEKRILLKPANVDFEPIVLTSEDDDDVSVIAEFIAVLPDPA